MARPTMQNTTQYNGYFGCSWCYHPGKLVAGQVKYPVTESEYPDRTEKEMLRHMEKAFQDGVSYKGVKGPSPLINVPHFNIVWGFTPDYMHCTLLGVTRQIAELWLTSVGREFYIGAPCHLQSIDSRLHSIHPPRNISRLPRSLKERKFF